jgi:hypothetical protein
MTALGMLKFTKLLRNFNLSFNERHSTITVNVTENKFT